MGKPQVGIEVDDATGRWSVDALPMILVPQHFFLNYHYAVEAVLGPEKLEEVLRRAGHCSAYFWCEKEAAHHGMSGSEVFRHYMRQITQRGWGQFDILKVELDNRTSAIAPFRYGGRGPPNERPQGLLYVLGLARGVA